MTTTITPADLAAYDEFVAAKVEFDSAVGFDVDPSLINPSLFPHQKAIVAWAVAGGRRARTLSLRHRRSRLHADE